MTSTSRKPRVVSSPTPRALRSITTFEPSVVPCTAWAASPPAAGAREADPVRIALAHLVRDRVLDGLAAGREVRALEEQERRARADLEQLGDLPRRGRGGP